MSWCVRGESYLFSQLTVAGSISIWSQLLLEKGEKDGDYDASLECLSEDDEEDGYCEEIDHLDGKLATMAMMKARTSSSELS